MELKCHFPKLATWQGALQGTSRSLASFTQCGQVQQQAGLAAFPLLCCALLFRNTPSSDCFTWGPWESPSSSLVSENQSWGCRLDVCWLDIEFQVRGSTLRGLPHRLHCAQGCSGDVPAPGSLVGLPLVLRSPNFIGTDLVVDHFSFTLTWLGHRLLF